MGKELKSFVEILDPNFVNSSLIGEIGAEKVVTITGFEQMEYYDQKARSNKLGSAVKFKECLPLILNATNTKTIKKLFSPNDDDTSLAIGHKIVLYVTTTKVAGEVKNCLRIKEYSEEKCSDCGQAILPKAGKTVSELIEISKRNCGRQLCLSCMQKVAAEKEAKDGK